MPKPQFTLYFFFALIFSISQTIIVPDIDAYKCWFTCMTHWITQNECFKISKYPQHARLTSLKPGIDFHMVYIKDNYIFFLYDRRHLIKESWSHSPSHISIFHITGLSQKKKKKNLTQPWALSPSHHFQNDMRKTTSFICHAWTVLISTTLIWSINYCTIILHFRSQFNFSSKIFR